MKTHSCILNVVNQEQKLEQSALSGYGYQFKVTIYLSIIAYCDNENFIVTVENDNDIKVAIGSCNIEYQ